MDAAVAVAGVEAVAGERMVFESEADDSARRGRADVDDRHRVVLLQRDPGGAAIGGDGDVLRLDVLGERRPAVGGVRVRRGDADALPLELLALDVEAEEVGRESDRVLRSLADVDHADRAFGIDRVVVARLAFVGREHVAAIGRECDHVGQCADANGGDRLVR